MGISDCPKDGPKGNALMTFATELKWLSGRVFKDSLRNPDIHWNKVFQVCYIGIIMALVYSDLDITKANQVQFYFIATLLCCVLTLNI